MYGVYGICTTSLHLMAKYWRLSLAVGMPAVAIMLVSPVGPGQHAGSDSILRNQEAHVLSEMPELKYRSPDVLNAFERVKYTDISRDDIKSVLDKCAICTDTKVDEVLNDEELLDQVKFLHFVNLAYKYDTIAEAEKAYSHH